MMRRIVPISVTVIFLSVVGVNLTAYVAAAQESERAQASRAYSYARDGAEYVRYQSHIWVVTHYDTTHVSESEYKINIGLSADAEYNRFSSLDFEIMSSEEMPYKGLWTELVKGSVITFDFYEDNNKGHKVYNYLIPRLEPGSPRDPK